ncbi:MAG: Carbamate kinase [Candidatus Heimdallarchaeota archaeon LC_2]|nr:MAG: Carbamate kinase [Candidatus Heimdallarchaeota archaeon LC_2]
MKIVIAIGGNMISDASNKEETFNEQLIRAKNTAKIISSIMSAGHQVVITHGNGPQVGSLLLQQAAHTPGSIELPLNVLGALTQGQIGIMLQHALINEFQERNIDSQVYIVPTTVFVDAADPGFKNPTKPIGPFYNKEEYDALDKTNKVYAELPKGFRRVVASPFPHEMLEAPVIEDLVDKGNLIIAVGGGGSPTVKNSNGSIQLVDAVIDKDLASAVLAEKINADMLLILTNVDGVFENFNTKDQQLISKLKLEDAEKMLETDLLGAGSMKPKLRACVTFVKNGKSAGITSPDFALQTVNGNAGTIIVS